MPLFEYQCADCGNLYEILIFHRDDGEESVCPKCHSHSTRRLMSTFAVSHASGGSEDLPSCSDGSCHMGGCGHGHGPCDFDDD